MSEQNPQVDENVSMIPPDGMAEIPESDDPNIRQDPYDLGPEEGDEE